MDNYYVNNNAQSNGDHEVHKDGCSYMPSSKISLGKFSDCHGAVKAAKGYYTKSNGCRYCCSACHTG